MCTGLGQRHYSRVTTHWSALRTRSQEERTTAEIFAEIHLYFNPKPEERERERRLMTILRVKQPIIRMPAAGGMPNTGRSGWITLPALVWPVLAAPASQPLSRRVCLGVTP